MIAPAALAACATLPGPAPSRFVTAAPDGLRRDGRPYRFVGANMAFAAYMGAEGLGDRDRLKRELDALHGMGVRNLRVMGGSELTPFGGLARAFRGADGSTDEILLGGLDFLLAEMARRDMTAVIYLTNFWDWSGGMMASLSWVNGGRGMVMNDPAHPWPAFPDFVSDFYGSEPAVAGYQAYVRALVGRTNSLTGAPYRDDPTILSWQLANEPRPGGSDAVAARALPAFQRWIETTAALIKTLDPNHLVSTGSEGLKGCVEREDCVVAAHTPAAIDYLTIHVWPHNWAWTDHTDLPGTFEDGWSKSAAYVDQHLGYARALSKPMVIEEFGFPRDGPDYAPGSPATFRDRFFTRMFDKVAASPAIAGSNVWSWAGEPGATWSRGLFRPRAAAHDPAALHEPAGWYDVTALDASTRAVMAAAASALA